MNWSGRRWQLVVTHQGLSLEGRKGPLSVTPNGLLDLEVRRSWFVWTLKGPTGRLAWLPGLSRTDADVLSGEIRSAALYERLRALDDWRADVDGTFQRHQAEQRWLPREELDRLQASRPGKDFRDSLRKSTTWNRLEAHQVASFEQLDRDLVGEAERLNLEITKKELRDRKEFFRTIERTPLTEEQAKAVICFDNRVQLLAAAGSGKTSVMVARAAYAVARGFIKPERVLLLAFNKAAADELQERVAERFAAAGIDSKGVRASTFHAFGLECIAKATGKKPSLGRWVEQGRESEKILEIVRELSAEDDAFRRSWEDYRLIYGSQRYPLGEGTPTDRDKEKRRPGWLTARGEIVKSEGEQQIANWLLLNGVEYEYEKPYEYDTATATHRQYAPDFYYPAIDCWHEHWAIGHDGEPPEKFKGYAESMQWKKEEHRRRGTDLIETTWSNIYRYGMGELEKQLLSRGVKLERDSSRLITAAAGRNLFVKEQDLTRTILTFMSHVKAAGLSRGDIEKKIEDAGVAFAQGRARVFLDIYWKIHDRWEADLAKERSIDFNDMLLQAAEHVSARRYTPPFDLILVDELQDTSRARAKLLQGLLNQPQRFLLGVGDDWQAINRFAGADISVMTEFAEWFGEGPQLALTKTFRCTQVICDVARDFIMQNPAQFEKEMTSAQGAGGVPIHILAPPPVGPDEIQPKNREDQTRRTVAYALRKLSEDAAKGLIRPTRGGKVTVDVLGRYSFDREHAMAGSPPANLQVTFRTVHGSKGLEADCIIVPGLVSETYGFPSAIVDDPVLALAMPRPDDFPDAEERRLFYVAVTRARQRVILLTQNENPSPFIFELLGESERTQITSEFIREGVGDPCHRCESGKLTWKEGKYGPFLSCSRYRACDFLQDDSRAKVATQRRSRAAPGSGTRAVQQGQAAAARAEYSPGNNKSSGARRVVMVARLTGWCSACRCAVEPGQLITQGSKENWIHADC
jgi:DNA helicase-4